VNCWSEKCIRHLVPSGQNCQKSEGARLCLFGTQNTVPYCQKQGATNEAGFVVIQRIIDFFKTCCQTHQKQVPEVANES